MPIPLRLLLVEDSEDDAILLRRVLRRAGYDPQPCRRVESAGEMAAALADCAWDLIISDHAMPGFSAPAALGLAKELCPDAPLVIVSGEIDLNLAVSLIKDGALDFIQKSELARLPAAVERVLRDQAERRERKRVDAELRESAHLLRSSEARFRALVENAPDMIFRFDRDCRHIYANPAVEKELGRPVASLLGKDFREIGQSPEQAAWSERIIRQVFETRGEVVFELETNTPRGTQYYLSRGVPEFDERGELTAALVIHRNITARKKATLELEERIRFETLLSDLSASLFQEAGGDIRALVERSLRRVVEFLGMDRGSLHELSEDGSALRVAYSYAVPGAVPALPALTSSEFPWYVEQLKNNQPALFDQIEDAPPEASAEVEFCRRGGVQAVMAVPLRSGETVSGALTFIAFHPVAPHNNSIVQRMRLIGELLLNAVRRSRAEAERAAAEQERQAMLLDLQRSEQRYELVTAASGQVVYDHSLIDGNIQWGGSIEQVLGYHPEELEGDVAQWEARVDPRDLAETRRRLEVTLRDGTPFSGEYGFRHKDGHMVMILDRGFLVPGPGGQNERLVGVMEDITERRRVESALRDSEARFRAIIEQNSEGVVLIDEEGRIIEWNQAQERMSGLSREEILGQAIWDVQARFALPERRDPEILMKHRQIMLDALRTGQSYIFDRPVEAVTQRADGARVYIQQTVFPIRVGDRFRLGLVTRDVTERRRAEAEIQVLNAALEQRVHERTVQLEAALKELEAFSYSVSHDLRAPLRHLDGYVRILQEDYSAALDKQGLHYLGRIQESAQHMGELIEALLNLSRVSRGDLTRGPVDLSRLAEEVAAGLRQREPERAVELTIQPGLVAQADETLMRAALQNLLGNAWKFTAQTDQARIEFGCQGNNPCTFFVRDNGAGFDMTAAARLFSPFYRLHSAQDFPGTGIGLATVQRIITRHGGKIWAESMPGEGAAFYFTL